MATDRTGAARDDILVVSTDRSPHTREQSRMMRRGLAAVILGLSLLVASASWAGFTLSRTVLDPGRSERLAEQLLESSEVRQALASRLAQAMDEQLPAAQPVPRQVLEVAANEALDSPAVQALVIDGLVEVHQNALNGVAEPVTIDGGAVAEAARASLVASRPEADQVLPPAPDFAFELPTAGLSVLGSVKQAVDRFVVVSALVSLTGIAVSFIVAKSRAAVLRRSALWGVGASAFWLALGYGLPWLANLLSPTSGAVAAAVIDVFFGAMIPPAITLAVISGVLFVVGLILPGFGRRRGARLMQPRSGPALSGRSAGQQARPVSPARSAPSPTAPARYPQKPATAAQHIGANPAAQPGTRSPQRPPAVRTSQPPPAVQPHQANPAAQPSQPTRVLTQPQQPSGAAPDATQTMAPRWVEGEGYTDD
jgi:hypothetical protein